MAKRQARTAQRRRQRERSAGKGSAQATGQAVAVPIKERVNPTADDAISAPTPWYARPPRRRLWALISVAVALGAWLCYLFWLAIVSRPYRLTPQSRHQAEPFPPGSFLIDSARPLTVRGMVGRDRQERALFRRTGLPSWSAPRRRPPRAERKVGVRFGRLSVYPWRFLPLL